MFASEAGPSTCGSYHHFMAHPVHRLPGLLTAIVLHPPRHMMRAASRPSMSPSMSRRMITARWPACVGSGPPPCRLPVRCLPAGGEVNARLPMIAAPRAGSPRIGGAASGRHGMPACRDMNEMVTIQLARAARLCTRVRTWPQLRRREACRRYFDRLRRTAALPGRPLHGPPPRGTGDGLLAVVRDGNREAREGCGDCTADRQHTPHLPASRLQFARRYCSDDGCAGTNWRPENATRHPTCSVRSFHDSQY